MFIRLLFLVAVIAGPPLAHAGAGRHFAQGTKGAFTGSNKWIWLVGGAATIVAFHYDHDIYRHYADKEKEEIPDSVGDVMGTGIPGAAIALLTMGTGYVISSDRTVSAGQSHGEALMATFAYTSVLKLVVERDRPPAFSNKESPFNQSFPSGHTSTAFATAGSLMASAGPWVGIPTLALAGLTGYSRIQQRAHFTGDVLFGAILGYTMGTGFYKHHSKSQHSAWQVLPYFETREEMGVVARLEF